MTSYARGAENQEFIWSEVVESEEVAKQTAAAWRARLPRRGRSACLVKWGARDVKFAGYRFHLFVVVAYRQHKSVPCAACGKPISWLKRELGGHRCARPADEAPGMGPLAPVPEHFNCRAVPDPKA